MQDISVVSDRAMKSDHIDIDIDQTQINVQINKIDVDVCKQKIQNIEDTQKVQLKDIDIEQSNLTHEQIEKVKDLLDKNSDIF
jgi:uncharacterized protein YpuA (DUF1002 family)